MPDTLDLQRISGKLFDLDWIAAEGAKIKIRLSQKLIFYKEETQIVGDERMVQVNQDGEWEVLLLDTDSMSDEAFYQFDINGRIYRRFVPVNVHGWDFYDLPCAL